MLHPRYKRYTRQTLVFGLIWLIFGLVYVFLEAGILGGYTFYPNTGVEYDFKTSLIYICIGSFVMGLVQGWIEVTWLKKRFAKNPFWVKILLKSIFYLLLLIVFLVILAFLISARRLGVPVHDAQIVENVYHFIGTFAFWSVIIYTMVILDIALFYSEVNSYLGNGTFYNYSLGKYHMPRQETRIFMFLDMKSSTTIAERLGHKAYFNLLKRYYADMTNPILETMGEIYEYVGDEIVVSWSLKNGLYKNNCIECFRKISDVLRQKKEDYKKHFGVMPSFKAGFHLGEVTAGEIGIIKKDIIYTGDVLNTTARIQALCNKYEAKILVSNELRNKLYQESDHFSFRRIEDLLLRGKSTPIQLFQLDFD